MLNLIIIGLAILVCLILSAFFSSSEMAFSSANTVRLENLAENGNKKAKRALFISNNFDSALSAILIGNNLVNIACSSLGSVFIITLTGSDNLTWISTVAITVLVVIFGETIPKISAKKAATTKSISSSLSVRVLMIILKPVVLAVVWLVNLILLPFQGEQEEEDIEESVEELQSIIETAEEEGILDEEDSTLIQNAIDFSEISASEVMTARVDVQAIDIDQDWDEIVELVTQTPYSRIPVYEDSIDNIIGVLHLNAFLKAAADCGTSQFDIKPLLNTPCYVYKTMKLPSVLNQLKSAKQHLAIVTDEYSGTLGVISMEDVLEQIVGEIWDENDIVEDEVVVKNENEFEVDGDLNIGEFLELLNIQEDEFEADSETAGGWAVEMLDRFPNVGDSFEFKDFKITVTAMDDLRVEKLLVQRKKQDAQ